MKINRVTLTGADDSVRPEQLIAITNTYPFVEWGVLFSPKRQGSPRYPSEKWVQEFANLNLPCAAHLCGIAVGAFISGWPSDDYRGFGRIQLNFNLHVKGYLLPKLPDVVAREKQIGRPIIFQMNFANQELSGKKFVHSILFDSSGGRGCSPTAWPQHDPLRYCGYSGGLGPDTLDAQLEEISKVVGDGVIWIDMESRIRSDDDRQFDLDKATRCLQIASRWI